LVSERILTDNGDQTIEYEPARKPIGAGKLVRIGVLAAGAGDLALLVAIFLNNGVRICYAYFHVFLPVELAQPIAAFSLLPGLMGIFASGISLVRPASRAWKVVGASLSILYLLIVICVVIFGLL
jgi:hypothetical protein